MHSSDNSSSSPRITAIIPTRDRPALCRRAIASVAAQIAPADQIIVVDDNPVNSDTGLYAAATRICGGLSLAIVRNQRTPGASGARNFGAQFATSEVIAFLDDDDEWLPEHLAQIRNVFRSGHVDVTCTDFLAKNGEAPEVPEKQAPDVLKAAEFMHHNPGLRGSNLAIRREVYLDLGGFDETMSSLNDLDFGIRLARRSGLRYVPIHARLVRFHNHDGPRLSTPGSERKRSGVRRFYELYACEMTLTQRQHFAEWVRQMWSVNEFGDVVGALEDAADGTSRSRPIT